MGKPYLKDDERNDKVLSFHVDRETDEAVRKAAKVGRMRLSAWLRFATFDKLKKQESHVVVQFSTQELQQICHWAEHGGFGSCPELWIRQRILEELIARTQEPLKSNLMK